MKNGHICFECSIKMHYTLNFGSKVCKAKCTLCKKVKEGASRKFYKPKEQ